MHLTWRMPKGKKSQVYLYLPVSLGSIYWIYIIDEKNENIRNQARDLTDWANVGYCKNQVF